MSHSQLPSGFLNLSPNPNRGAALGVDTGVRDEGVWDGGSAAASVYFSTEESDKVEHARGI